jgi:hypothetical protein
MCTSVYPLILIIRANSPTITADNRESTVYFYFHMPERIYFAGFFRHFLSRGHTLHVSAREMPSPASPSRTEICLFTLTKV